MRKPGAQYATGWPLLPPTQAFIANVRTRGVERPANAPNVGTTVERSAGHRHRLAQKQYCQSGLFLMSCSISQLDRSLPLKFRSPVTQTPTSRFGMGGHPLE